MLIYTLENSHTLRPRVALLIIKDLNVSLEPLEVRVCREKGGLRVRDMVLPPKGRLISALLLNKKLLHFPCNPHTQQPTKHI